jgi:hypothetical protein
MQTRVDHAEDVWAEFTPYYTGASVPGEKKR